MGILFFTREREIKCNFFPFYREFVIGKILNRGYIYIHILDRRRKDYKQKKKEKYAINNTIEQSIDSPDSKL